MPGGPDVCVCVCVCVCVHVCAWVGGWVGGFVGGWVGGFMSLCVCVYVSEEWGKFNSSHIPRLSWGVIACNNVCSRSSYPCVTCRSVCDQNQNVNQCTFKS